MCVRIILKYKIHERDEIIHDIVGFLKHEFIVSAYLIPKIAYFNKHIHKRKETQQRRQQQQQAWMILLLFEKLFGIIEVHRFIADPFVC